MKKQSKDNYIRETKKQFIEPVKQYLEPTKVKGHIEAERKVSGGLMRQQSERYRHASDRVDHSKYIHNHQNFESFDRYDRDNLTDRQKYREIVESKQFSRHESPIRHDLHRSSGHRSDKRDFSPEHVRTIQRKSKASERFDPHETSHAHDRNKHKIAEELIERNPYREPDSLPYRESIESMMKSPVMKYKSRIPYERSPSHERYPIESNTRKQSNRSFSSSVNEREVYVKDPSPMSTMKKTSPKDRFQDAKEKFQAMEKIRLKQEPKQLNVRRTEPSRYEKDYRQSYSPEPRYHVQNDWSSEDELAPNVRDYRDRDVQGHHQQQRQHQQQRFMAPAKSLGNLTKGYRHSYAEPMKYCNRVGLAAIEPY